MGLLVKPAPTGAIKSPVHRLLLPRIILPAFLSLSLSLPRFSFFSCPWAARPGRGIGGKIVGEERRLALKGVPQNSWDTSIGNGGEERREALVKAASLGPVIAAAARPREIAVRRKYGLMLPPFLLRLVEGCTTRSVNFIFGLFLLFSLSFVGFVRVFRAFNRSYSGSVVTDGRKR